jgi:serine/threonine protein kinase
MTGVPVSAQKVWRKTGNAVESSIYESLGTHPRILPYYGVDPRTKNILLPRLANGDLWNHLATHKNIPLDARITWAIEIAQGLAHLHAKQVVWADAHLRNVLLTDDFHMVLCDFRFSLLNPSYFHLFSTSPPPVFMCPLGYLGNPPTRVDVFGFGIILYVLLENRFPFCRDLLPPMEEQVAAYQNHCRRVFDTLTDPSLNSSFGRVVADCFAASYTSGEELVKALEGAYESWTNLKVVSGYAVTLYL